MTILTATDNAYILTSKAIIVEDEQDIASTWASKHIYHNPALKWIVGNYVEADRANRNGQYWSLDDLRMKGSTVNYAPMNIGHNKRKPVGAYVASEMIYPTSAEENPYIETVAAMWRSLFPEQYASIQEAYEEGSLFQSMECVADSVTCVGTDDACGNTFDYVGPFSPTYCEHIQNHSAAKQFDNPTFTGGGLIIPPDKPGWHNAEIQEVAQFTETEAAAQVYEQVSDEAPELEPEKWEALMQMIVLEEASKSSNDEEAQAAGRLLGIAIASTL